jgi:hypothetical protein
MPCSFGLLPYPRSGTGAQPNGRLGVTVSVRCIPLVTAAYGTRVAWPARTTMLRPDGDDSQLDHRVRPVLGEPLLVGRARRAHGSRVGRLELHSGRLPHPRSEGWSWGNVQLRRTSGDRPCPLLSAVHPPAMDPARTKGSGPSGRGGRDRRWHPRPGIDRSAGTSQADQCRTNTLQLSPRAVRYLKLAVRTGDGDQTNWLAWRWSAHSPDPCTRSQTPPSPGR